MILNKLFNGTEAAVFQKIPPIFSLIPIQIKFETEIEAVKGNFHRFLWTCGFCPATEPLFSFVIKFSFDERIGIIFVRFSFPIGIYAFKGYGTIGFFWIGRHYSFRLRKTLEGTGTICKRWFSIWGKNIVLISEARNVQRVFLFSLFWITKMSV